MKSWLIQRGKFKIKDKRCRNIYSLDELINFDYMGSSEFEWGALPKALNRMIENWSDFEIVGTGIRDDNKRELFVICDKNYRDETIECVVKVSNNIYGYKEWCDMGYELGTIKSAFRMGPHNDFWWDIENDWMACVSSDRVKQLKYAIERVISIRKEFRIS